MKQDNDTDKKEFEEKVLDEVKEEKKKDVAFTKQLEKDLSPTDLISSIFQTPEQDKDKVLEILFEHPDLRKVSDITPSEIIDMSVLLTFEKEMNSPLIKFFCETRLALSFSKERKSRAEIVEIYKTNMYSDMDEQPRREGMFSRFRNRFSGGLP